jgi:hypothetical protein
MEQTVYYQNIYEEKIKNIYKELKNVSFMVDKSGCDVGL